MSITEAFYKLRMRACGIPKSEAIDTIHAEIERLKGEVASHEQAIGTLTKTTVDQAVRNGALKSELEKAQACCAERRDVIELLDNWVTYLNGGKPCYVNEVKQALSSTCGTALLEELQFAWQRLFAIYKQNGGILEFDYFKDREIKGQKEGRV